MASPTFLFVGLPCGRKKHSFMPQDSLMERVVLLQVQQGKFVLPCPIHTGRWWNGFNRNLVAILLKAQRKNNTTDFAILGA